MTESSMQQIPSLSDRSATAIGGGGAVQITASGDGRLTEVDLQLFGDRSAQRVEAWITEAAVHALDEATSDIGERSSGSSDIPPRPKAPPTKFPFVVTRGQVTATVGDDKRLSRVRIEQVIDSDQLARDVIAAVNEALAKSASGPDSSELSQTIDKRIADLGEVMEQLKAELAVDPKTTAPDREQ